MIEGDIKALASDPQAPGDVLQELAMSEPSLRPAIALNPAAYPALVQWLASLDDPAVAAALKQRSEPRSSTSTTARSWAFLGAGGILLVAVGLFVGLRMGGLYTLYAPGLAIIVLAVVLLIVRPWSRSASSVGSHRGEASRSGVVAHTNNLAVAALISAFVVWPAGLILGHVAPSQIRRTGEQGRGLAITAVTIGWLAAAACVVGVLVFAGALNS